MAPSPATETDANLPRRGSPLLTLAVVLCLASVATWATVPRLQERHRDIIARQAVADLRRFAAAFQSYAHDNGDWPPTTAPGAIPAGMEKALADSAWTGRTPIGGHYVWLTDSLQRGQRIHAIIAIASTPDTTVSDDRRVLEALLREAKDDGQKANPIKLGFRNEPICVLEQ